MFYGENEFYGSIESNLKKYPKKALACKREISRYNDMKKELSRLKLAKLKNNSKAYDESIKNLEANLCKLKEAIDKQVSSLLSM